MPGLLVALGGLMTEPAAAQSPGMSVSTPKAINEGDTGTYTVVLNTQPTAAVTVSLSVSDDSSQCGAHLTPSSCTAHQGIVTVDKTSLSFSTSDWATAQTVTVTAVDEDIAGIFKYAKITHTPSGGNYDGASAVGVSITVIDDDSKDITYRILNQDDALEKNSALGVFEGRSDSYYVELATQPTADTTVTLTSEDPALVSLDEMTQTLTFTATNWNSPQQVRFEVPDDQVDQGFWRDRRVQVKIPIQFAGAGSDYVGYAAHHFTVNIFDDDVGVAVSPTALSILEGTSETYALVLGTEPYANVVITVSSDNTNVATVDQSSLTFEPSNWDTPQTVEVTGLSSGRVTISHSGASAENVVLSDVEVSVSPKDDDRQDEPPQPRLSIWTDRIGYLLDQEILVYWDMDPKGDDRHYSVFCYRENIETGERLYLAPQAWDSAPSQAVVDVYGESVDTLRASELPRVEKDLLWRGHVDTPGLWQFVVELRSQRGTQVLKRAYAKFVVPRNGYQLLARRGIERVFATDARLTRDAMYRLGGRLRVMNGATLTIDAGTLIEAWGPDAAIIVDRGGRIEVLGRRDAPVVMGCALPVGERTAGCWKGLIVKGRLPAGDTVGGGGGDSTWASRQRHS